MTVQKPGSRPRAGAVAAPKVGTTVAPPAGAHHWTLTRLTNKTVKNTETGRQRQQTFSERMRGDPGSDGVVADAWLVSEFSPQHILARWGAGRYRVDWYNPKNDRVAGDVFEVLEPKPRTRVGGSRVAPQVEGDDVQQAPTQSAGGMPTDPWSLMLFMQQREEAAAERERQRAEAQRDRDREFYAQLQVQNASNLQAMLAANTRPAPASDAGLAQREIALSMGELSLKMEKRLAAALDELNVGGDDGDDPTPPGSLEEAGSRIGMKLLGELEQKAPELLEEAIPRIATWLKSKGFASSTDLEDELAALRKRRAKKTGTE